MQEFRYRFKKSPLDERSCDELFSSESECVAVDPDGKCFLVTSSLDVLDIRKKYPDWDIKIYINNSLPKSKAAITIEEDEPENEEEPNDD